MTEIRPNQIEGVTASAAELNILDGATLTTTELNYVDGVTSAIQTQLNGKLTTGGTAAAATALATPRTIGGVSFDGTADIVPRTIQIVDAAADTTTFPLLATSATGSLQPATDAGLAYNASTNALTTTTFIGALSGNASTATSAGTLTTPRTIGNVSFNGSANIVPQTIQVIDAAADTTTFPMLAGSATGNLQPLTDAGLAYNASTNALTAGSFVGAGTGLTGTAASLTSGITNALASATTTVNVSSATAPTAGQVLTATSSTAATWQPASGDGNSLAEDRMELSTIKQVPVDFLNAFSDSFFTTTRIDLANSTNENISVAGQVSNLVAGSRQIPTMTSNSAPAGTAIASTEFGGSNAAWHAMDKNIATYWATASVTTGTLEYDPVSSTTVSQYVMRNTPSGSSFMAKDWTFEYWNGSSWVVADTQVSAPAWGANEERTYTLASNVTGTKFRLNITTTGGGSILQIGEFDIVSADSGANASIRSTAVDIDTIPATVDCYALITEVDALTLNTDLIGYATRNNLTTWTSGTITKLGNVGTNTLIKWPVTVSGQSSGDDIGLRLDTANSKRVIILSWYAIGRS